MINLPEKTAYDEYVYTEKEQTYSYWINNTEDTMSFRLMTNEKRVGKDRPGKHTDGSKCQGSMFLKVVIKPGETVKLDSQYDMAIRKISPKTGQVCGGVAPCLTKVGEENIVIPDVFDYKSAIMEEEAASIIKTIKKERDIRDAQDAIEEKRKRRKEQEQKQKKLEAKLAEEASLSSKE